MRELFEKEPAPIPRKSRAELMKDIDADYYGYRDDDDGILMPLEKEAEKKGIKRLTFLRFLCHIILTTYYFKYNIKISAIAAYVNEWKLNHETNEINEETDTRNKEEIPVTIFIQLL